MYLPETEVRLLLQRLTDQFSCGEMYFDTISPLGPLASKVFTKGTVKWGIGDARALEKWNPKLHLLERKSALAGYRRIPSTSVRLIYQLVQALPLSAYDVLNRFAY